MCTTTTARIDKKRRDSIDPRAIKALALDLDGTLLRPDSTLSKRTIRVLKICMDRGVAVIICTGRSSEASEAYRSAIGAAGPMVYYNGAEVMDMPSGRILGAALLDLEVADYCVDLARSRGIYFHLFLPGTPDNPREVLASEGDGKEADMYRKRTGLSPSFRDLKTLLAAPGIAGCIKGMFIAEEAVLDTIKPDLEKRFGGRIYMARSYAWFLEILASGVSKGLGLRQALEHRGIAPAQAIAFGDEENDLPMFSVAGFSVAPANAKESILRAADIHTGPNSEDGVAVFLEELFGV
jgi:Cof subfamily protein (haloacid dehalogenase superfamily)